MNSHWVRVIGYVVLVALCTVARGREKSRANEVDGVWPTFWWLTTGFLAVMAIGRAGDIGSLLSELGRGRALDSGWYRSRRPLQAVVVAGLGATWLTTVLVACWRTPERRRRYLPMGVMVVTLVAYAAIRVVSLHQVDTLLHRRDIAGVRVGTVIEITLLLIAALVTLWVPAAPIAATAESPDPPSARP